MRARSLHRTPRTEARMRRVIEAIQSFGSNAFPKQANLAKRAGMTKATLVRMLDELKRDGILTTEMRGPTSCLYFLSINHQMAKPLAKALAKPLAKASAPHLFTELKTEEKKNQSKSAETDSLSFEKAQTQAIETNVRGCGLEPTPDLIATLHRKAQFYRVNGFVIAAAIDRAWRKVQGKSTAPQGPGWIIAVVENELAGSASRERGCVVPGDPAHVLPAELVEPPGFTSESPRSPLEEKPPKQTRRPPGSETSTPNWLGSEIALLAQSKRINGGFRRVV